MSRTSPRAAPARRVLVTGVGGVLGAAAATRLVAEPDVALVIGVDSSVPVDLPRGVEFLHADLRHQLLGRVIAAARIDTVLHLGVIHDELAVRPRSAHESSVLGTVNLLAACSEADSPVGRLVVRSSAAVYGCAPGDPSLRVESEESRALDDALGRDALEVEAYVREHMVRRPSGAVVLLRFGELVAPGTWVTRWLTGPAIPAVLGFDPRLQLLHLEDAVSAVLAAAANGSRGCHNVAGAGVVLLSQAAARLGRPLLPLLPPVAESVPIAAIRRLGGYDLGGQRSALLRHGRVLSTRSLSRQLAVTTRPTAATLASLAGGPVRDDPPFGNLGERQLEELLRSKGSGAAGR
ncbi:MAG: NAD-dependent epimerase/dehydratase family protein [Candidatus Dormibacteria bacterium]